MIKPHTGHLHLIVLATDKDLRSQIFHEAAGVEHKLEIELLGEKKLRFATIHGKFPSKYQIIVSLYSFILLF